jgi:hypothetical protein
VTWNNTLQLLPFIALIFGLFWAYHYLSRRTRRPDKSRPDLVRNLLTDVRINRAQAQLFNVQKKPKKFYMYYWNRSKKELDFLGQSGKDTLTEAYTMAEEFNRQMDEATKQQPGTVPTLDAAKLRELFIKSEHDLENWLKEKTGSIDGHKKYPGIFDGWLGGGS